MQKKTGSLRYAAGACFAIAALMDIIYVILNEYMSMPIIAVIAGNVLLAVAMFASVPVLVAVGGGLQACAVIRTFFALFAVGDMPMYMLSKLLLLAAWILIVVAGLLKSGGKILGIIAGALAALQGIAAVVFFKLVYGFVPFPGSTVFLRLVTIAGMVMVGLAVSSNTAPAAAKAAVPMTPMAPTAPVAPMAPMAPAAPAAVPVEKQVERLTKLKELLDSGLITQEEFDAKKKEILGK